MGLTDARWTTLVNRFGGSYVSSTLNDLLARWRAAESLTGFSEESQFLRSRTGLSDLGAAENAYWDSPLNEAVLWLDADVAEGVRNMGTGGAALDAIPGGVGRARILRGALQLPGLNGNYASVPHSAALSFTGDIEMVARANLKWSSCIAGLVTKWTGGGSQYVFAAVGGRLYAYMDGSYPGGVWSNVHALLDDVTYWVKMTQNVTTGLVSWYYAADTGSSAIEPSSWTLISSGGSTPGARSGAGTSRVNIGCWHDGTSAPAKGNISRAIIREGIGGTAVLDVDLNLPDTTRSFVCTTGQTVTVNAATTANDPLHLAHSGTNYVYLPGVAGNYLSVPDAAALDITGDLELVFRVSADDWTPATSNRYPFGKWNTSQQSWLVELTTGGLLRLYWSTTGTDALSGTSGAAVPFTDDTNYWVKITLDVDNGAGGSQGRFYYAADQATEPTSWTQLTAPAAGVGTTSIFAGTANVHVGAAQSLTPNFPGRFYRFIVRSGIGGTTVLDVDTSVLTDDGATSFTATTGQTVTINRPTSGRKTSVVTRAKKLFGTDDYMEIADNALLDFGASDSFTALVVGRRFDTSSTRTWIAKKTSRAAGAAGWEIYGQNVTWANIADGTTVINANDTFTTGAQELNVIIRNVTADTVTGQVGSTAGTPVADTTTGSLANSEVLRIGALSGVTPSEYLDGEVIAVAVFDRALTARELSAIAARYGVA